MKFLGRSGDEVLFQDESFFVVVDEAKNIVSYVDDTRAIVASADWDEQGSYAQSSYDLAVAAVSDLDIHVFSSSERMYTIPKAVQAEAKRSLEWHKEHHRGGTPVGLNTARILAKGGQIGIRKIRHIAKYFPRHEVDKKGTGYKPSEKGYPSNGRIAWALWGGDAAQTWASAIVERENKNASVTASIDFTDSVKLVDVSSFEFSSDVIEENTPEFFIRLYADGSGFDRLYVKDLSGFVSVWDDGVWSNLSESFTDFFSIDECIDKALPSKSFSYVLVDSDAALVASAHLDANPSKNTFVSDVDTYETELAALALEEIDWNEVDAVMHQSAFAQDGQYTPDERAAIASKAKRDAGGKFSKGGGGGGTAPSGAQGLRPQYYQPSIDPATGKPVTDNVAPSPKLDLSGVLGQPRDVFSNTNSARLPNRYPPLTSNDINMMIGDWPAWVSDQRSKVNQQATPSIQVNSQEQDHLAPNAYNDPYLRSWLDEKRSGKSGSSYPNRSWYNPVRTDDVEAKKNAKTVGKAAGYAGKTRTNKWNSSTTSKNGVTTTTRSSSSSTHSILDGLTAAAEEAKKSVELTPETSDVPAIYMAIVAQDDPQAVMDLVCLIPISKNSTQPTTFKRSNGKWIKDEQILSDLNSPTPPPVIVLDDEDLKSVLDQMEPDDSKISKAEKAAEGGQPVTASTSIDEYLAQFWSSDAGLLPLSAAGGVDRNRGNAERLRRYWVHGEGAAKIRWGQPGDWARCVRHLSKYLGVRAKGYCQLRHKEAIGIYTATHAAKDRRHKNLSIDFFEPDYDFNPTIVTEDDMAKSIERINAEIQHDYDEEWNPHPDIVVILQDAANGNETLLAAGGADRNKGNAEKLRRYWTIGEGGAKIRWGTGGDWTRCVRHLSKYLGVRAKGYCALRHKEMTGMWTGDKAHRQMYGRKGRNAFVTSDEIILSQETIVEQASLRAQAEEAKRRVLVASASASNPIIVEETAEGSKFYIPLVVPEGVETGDGRKFSKGAIGMRELPLPLLWQIQTADGHNGSVVVGRIDRMERTDDGIGNAYGVFDTGEYGKEAERLVRGGFIKGISADLDRFEADEETADEAGSNSEKKKIGASKLLISKARVMGVTLVAKPAFQECTIKVINKQEDNVNPKVNEQDALIACAAVVSSIPMNPPTAWFENPKLKQPTPLTVTDDGQVFGHIAAWHVDHIGLAMGTKPPRSKSKYAYFHTGVIRTNEGSDIPVGQLTLAGGHASLSADAAAAAKHYDDTGSAFADVHAGEDAYGIWVSGALRPSVTPEQVRAARASAPSGDWRPIGNSLELVAVCQVNVPGFPIARARVASGQVYALVAAGASYLAQIKADPSILGEAENAKARFNSIRKEIETLSSITADGYGAGTQPITAETLNKLLSDVISFYFRAHGYHWNVTGEDFSEYHELFGEIYEDVYSSIDPIAENIRKLGFFPPINLTDFISLRSIQDSDVDMTSPKALAASLLMANEDLVEELQYAFGVFNAANEQGICNFLAERIDHHQKWSWQLSSSLVPEMDIILTEGRDRMDAFESVFSILERQGLVASAGKFGEFANLSEEMRKDLAKSGKALPDGSYPIRNVSDLKKAIRAYGRSNPSDRAKVRKHIVKRAKSLGKPELIPSNWKEYFQENKKANKELSSTFSRSSELSLIVDGLRSRASKAASLTADAGLPAAQDVTADKGQVVRPKYSAETQPRDIQGRFRTVLARLKQDLGTASLDAVAKRVQQAENLDNVGNYAEAAKAASDVVDIVDRLDTGALDKTALENVRASSTALAKVISNLPLPFENQAQKIRYSDVPPALRKLMDDMMAKVEQKIGSKDAAVSNKTLMEFKTGARVFSQADISSEMNKLLRLLT
jgi:DNA-binding ferritin-like protein